MSIHSVKKSLRFLIFFLSFILLVMPCFAKTIALTLNGRPLESTTAPTTEKGTVLVPLRIISENLGATVNHVMH